MKKLVEKTVLAAMCAALVLVSCKEDYLYTEVVGADTPIVPEKLSYNGGIVTLSLENVVETKTAVHIVPWAYRLEVDGVPQEPVVIDELLETLEIEIPANYTTAERNIDIYVVREVDGIWQKRFSFTQAAGVIQMVYEGTFDTFWAKGNIDVKDGKFIVAEKYSDPGLFFIAGSAYGVKAQAYDGKAYNPSEVEISLAEIAAQPAADPCKLLSETFRTPSYADFYFLENINYEDQSFDWNGTQNGVNGIRFKNSEFFLPFSGVVSRETGSYSLSGTNAGYWFLGTDAEGYHNIYTTSTDYTSLYVDLEQKAMANVRCVLDRKLPVYKSHSFSTGTVTDKQMTLDVVVDLGEYPLASVEAVSSNGDIHDASATDNVPTASVYIPANKTHSTVDWKIFVNRIDTGIQFTQPEMKDYAVYVSHTPASSDYKSFTLSVTVDTDLASVPVVVKGAGADLTQTASSSNKTVSFTIPENTESKERTLAIWVNGVDTKKTVKQGAAPSSGLSVEWSTGALKVAEGAYVFAGAKERGWLFQFKSKYAIEITGTYSSTSTYPGFAYAPQQTTVSYTSIPRNEVDPCSLVAPAGTWRMPTKAEVEEIAALENGSTDNSTYKSKKDGESEIFFVGAGQMNDSGTGITLPTVCCFWTSTEGTTAGQYVYGMWSMNSSTGKLSASSAGAKQTKGLQVRCVKSRQ